MTDQNLSNMYIVMPDQRVQFGRETYDGNSDNNVFECSNPREIVSAVKNGVVMSIPKYQEAQEEKAQTAIAEAEKAREAAEKRVEVAKESLKDMVAKSRTMQTDNPPPEPPKPKLTQQPKTEPKPE